MHIKTRILIGGIGGCPRSRRPLGCRPRSTPSLVIEGGNHPVGASLFGFDPEALPLGYARCPVVAPSRADLRIHGTASDAVDDGRDSLYSH